MGIVLVAGCWDPGGFRGVSRLAQRLVPVGYYGSSYHAGAATGDLLEIAVLKTASAAKIPWCSSRMPVHHARYISGAPVETGLGSRPGAWSEAAPSCANAIENATRLALELAVASTRGAGPRPPRELDERGWAGPGAVQRKRRLARSPALAYEDDGTLAGVERGARRERAPPRHTPLFRKRAAPLPRKT